jgi:hypothetical protein
MHRTKYFSKTCDKTGEQSYLNRPSYIRFAQRSPQCTNTSNIFRQRYINEFQETPEMMRYQKGIKYVRLRVSERREGSSVLNEIKYEL